MSRADLARRLMLSATTITRAVNELEAEGVLAEGTVQAPGAAGRPAVNLRIRADNCLVGSVQIGIGVVHLGIVDAQGGHVASRQFMYDAKTDRAQSTLALVARELGAMCKASGVAMDQLRGIGVAVPGPVDAQGRKMLVSIRLNWGAVDIAGALEKATGVAVAVEHNVRSMALAEARFGRGRGLDSVAFVYLRSGLGAGLVVHGQPFSGGVHGAIELGHLPVINGGARCICGGRGCIETVLSEAALTTTLTRLRIAAHPNALAALWDASMKREDAAQAVEAIVTPLATGLNALTTLLNPNLVVLGGALEELPDAMFERIVKTTWSGAFPLIRESIRIERSRLGLGAGLAGAAAVALDRFLYA